MSPFANTRTRDRATNAGNETERNGCCSSNQDNARRLCRWLPVIETLKRREKYLFSAMDLSKALHGFLVFEVSWKDVHGINYLNELQTDTSLALEVKSMKKWEFYSPDQALSCLSVWFSGRKSEIQSVKDNLRKLCDPKTDHWHDDSSSEEILHECSDVQESPHETDDNMNSNGSEKRSEECVEMDGEPEIGPTHYSDKLLLFRFNDSLLPFKLRQIIISELRLLTLLESGLPSWVIFFQSYPLFCHFYRPWMRHLARTLYILISLVTVIIGFYDLYKNVPLLKVTASRICGPLFSWIEAWDMASRIQYLGTMLFLQNLERGFKWFMMIIGTGRTVLAAIARPFSAPLSEVAGFISPLWDACSETAELFLSTAWFAIESMYNIFLDLIDVFVSPFELLYSYICTIAIPVYPLACSLWELLLFPIRCIITLASYLISLLFDADDFVRYVWGFARNILQLAYVSKAKQGANEISVWRGLWNDLFSQVFRASGSIIKGLLAFFSTCNRHRLSTSNQIRAFFLRLARFIHLAPRTCQCKQRRRIQHLHEEEEHTQCHHCE
ncbi:uncharacterized protein LOC120275460 isoform X2 [Dioscorea cayenensis subsp. rotundata]|nr:uncharacterized protein LOC120275460 isoform X2 [Dioscorea cayenensis subsp. rotundata]